MAKDPASSSAACCDPLSMPLQPTDVALFLKLTDPGMAVCSVLGVSTGVSLDAFHANSYALAD